MKVYLIAKFWKLLWNDIQFGTWFIILCWGNAATCDLMIVTWTLMLYWFAVDTFMLSYFYVSYFALWLVFQPSFILICKFGSFSRTSLPNNLNWIFNNSNCRENKNSLGSKAKLNQSMILGNSVFEIKDTFSMSNYIKTPFGSVGLCKNLLFLNW